MTVASAFLRGDSKLLSIYPSSCHQLLHLETTELSMFGNISVDTLNHIAFMYDPVLQIRATLISTLFRTY